jgi:hypothetical protein
MGMMYEAAAASYGARSVPLGGFAGGLLGAGQTAELLHSGAKAWRDGEHFEAAILFIGESGPALSLFGPVGKGLSIGVGLTTLGYRNRRKILEYLGSTSAGKPPTRAVIGLISQPASSSSRASGCIRPYTRIST